MKRVSLLALAFLSISVLAVSCKKSDNNPTCAAGQGGNTELVVYAIYNGDTLIHSAQQPDTAFLAWGDAGDPPNPNYYDKAYVAEAGENHIHMHNLNCGNYRVRLSIFDSTSGMRRSGYQAVSFTKSSGEVEAGINVN